MASGAPADSICSDGVAIVREFLAVPKNAAAGRAVLRSFLEECAVKPEWIHEVMIAGGEALANVVQHAYPVGTRGKMVLSIYCCTEHKVVALQVRDRGRGTMTDESDLPSRRGFGHLIMRALAEAVSIETAEGTTVTMVFKK
ncbi:MAG: ATP-binding protein [Vulcanimicrobiaceae bacterium]|jgi:anti-sigma regulatory factor (Ser/Thr protein kinase)